MSNAWPRSIEFRVPLVEDAPEACGLRPARHGRTAMVEGSASVRQAILMLLMTRPGERVMRPGYGCDLHRLLFSPNDDTTAGLAIHYVRRAIERWEPRVEIVRLDARRDPSCPGRLDLVLEYRIPGLDAIESMLVPLELNGAR